MYSGSGRNYQWSTHTHTLLGTYTLDIASIDIAHISYRQHLLGTHTH